MNAITITAQTIPAQATITPTLFAQFVHWLDRGERTTRAYLTNFRQFLAWLKYSGITTPQRADILSYKQWLAVEHDAIALDAGTAQGWIYRTDASGNPIKVTCKPNTIAGYLRVVAQFFRWTQAQGLYPDIAANIHAPKVTTAHRKDALDAEAVLAIETSITAKAQEKTATAATALKDTAGRIQRSTEQGKRLYAMYLLAVTTGLRTIEISRANVKDFETKGDKAFLAIWGKGHTEADQRKPITPEVAEAIRDYLASRTDAYTGTSPLFVSTGNRSGGKRIATTTISTMLKKAMQDAGYNSERLTAHSLRHTAAQAALQASGHNLYATQKYLRHANPATTEIYLHEDEATARAERNLAQGVYDLYHGTTTAGGIREKLEGLISTLDPYKLERLAGIAEAMAI